jgi:hypothetical protein
VVISSSHGVVNFVFNTDGSDSGVDSNGHVRTPPLPRNDTIRFETIDQTEKDIQQLTRFALGSIRVRL